MVLKKIGEKIAQRVANKVCVRLTKSDEGLLNLLKWAQKVDNKLARIPGYTSYEKEISMLMQGAEGKIERHPTLNLFEAVLSSKSEKTRNKFMVSAILNSGFYGNKRRAEFEEKNGFRSPYFMVISPTMRCNLNCIGCYAGKYDKTDLSFDLVDRIINQGNEIGTYFYVLSGGEVFLWPRLFELLEKHQDSYFLLYTNGTLINEKTAEKIAELGNIAPSISVEGFEKGTDARRGKGVFKKAIKAMGYLEKQGVLFGFSTTATKRNTELIATNEFIDYYIDKGCKFGWYFQYLPIGKEIDVDLMATPEQRNYLRQRINDIRKRNTSFYIADFWNDGNILGGCIAAGKYYLHINSNGDVEPCAFIHFAVDNIKAKSLEEVLKSDFFKAIRARQPYHQNLYAPCMLIDNPTVLREIIQETGARGTHVGAENPIISEKIKTHLDDYSKKIHALTDSLPNPFA